MTGEIKWDVLAVSPKLNTMRSCIMDYVSIPKVEYDLAEGMKVMEQFEELKENLDLMMEEYLRAVSADVANIESALEEFGEVDEALVHQLVQDALLNRNQTAGEMAVEQLARGGYQEQTRRSYQTASEFLVQQILPDMEKEG